jgi:hypothetical protein
VGETANGRRGDFLREVQTNAAALHASHQFALPQEAPKLTWPATRIRASPVRRFAHSPIRLLAPRFELLAPLLITDSLITDH